MGSVLGLASPRGVASKTSASQSGRDPYGLTVSWPEFDSDLTSDQVGIPPELKHINKARNRNQPGFPQ